MACQTQYFGAITQPLAQGLDIAIQLVEQIALPIVAYHALRPEETAHSLALGDGSYLVQAGGGIQNQITCGQFHFVTAVGVLHD
jgi:hypothetical protein